jgi:hypothetical protein
MDIPLHGSDDMSGLNKIYDDMADNPNTASINYRALHKWVKNDTAVSGPAGSFPWNAVNTSLYT